MEKEFQYPLTKNSTVKEMISLLNKRHSAPNGIVTVFEQLTGQSFFLKIKDLDSSTKEVFIRKGEQTVYHCLYKKAKPHWRIVNCFYEESTKISELLDKNRKLLS